MFTLLERSFDSKQSPKSKRNFIEVSNACSDYFGQADITPEFVAAKVKTLLQSHRTSKDGLLLLDCYLSSFPNHVVETDSVFWVKSVVQLLLQGKRCGQHTAWRMLERLLCLLVDWPNQATETANMIPALVEKICLDVFVQDGEPEEGAIRCLLTCMKHYGMLLGSIQNSLEKFLLRLVVSWNSPPIQELVCKCMALLPFCRREGPKRTEAWLNQMQRLLVTAHVSLDKLLEDLHQVSRRGSLINTLPLEMPLGAEDSHQGTLLCWRRIVTVVQTVGLMLESNFHQAGVPVKDILYLLQRVLETQVPVMGAGASAQANVVAAILPSIQYEAVLLLCQLGKGCRRLLHKDAKTITELIEDVILRTKQDSSCDLRRLRQAGYGALCLWLPTLSSSMPLGGSLNNLLPVMLQDAEPVSAAAVVLSSRNSKHRKSRDGHVKVKEGLQPEVRAQLCEQALRALSALISVNGPVMEPGAWQEVQSSVVHLLIRLQQQQVEGFGDSLPQPYRFPSCRHALYTLLLTLLVHPHPRLPHKPLLTFRLLTTGNRDCSRQVADLCNQGLAVCHLIASPNESAVKRQAAPGEPLRFYRASWRQKDAVCQTAVKPTTPACTQTTAPATPAPVVPQKRVLTSYRTAKRGPGSAYQTLSDEEELLSDVDEEYLELRSDVRDPRPGARMNGQGHAHHPPPSAANAAVRVPNYANAEDSSYDEECSDEGEFDEDDEECEDYMESELEQHAEADLIELESDEAHQSGKRDDAMEEHVGSDVEEVVAKVDPPSGDVEGEPVVTDKIYDGDAAKENRAEAACGDVEVSAEAPLGLRLEGVESLATEADRVKSESACLVLENHQEGKATATDVPELQQVEAYNQADVKAIIGAEEPLVPQEVHAKGKEDDSPDVDGMLRDLVDIGHDN